MDCKQAKELIDIRVQEGFAEGRMTGTQPPHPTFSPGAGERGLPELEAHLRTCPACAAEMRELLQTRRSLAEVAADAPSNKEIEKMLQAITANVGALAPSKPLRSSRRAAFEFIGISGALAAVLGLAFVLGSEEYGSPLSWLPQLSRVRELGTAVSMGGSRGIMDEVDGSKGGGVPANASQSASRTGTTGQSVFGNEKADVSKLKYDAVGPAPAMKDNKRGFARSEALASAAPAPTVAFRAQDYGSQEDTELPAAAASGVPIAILFDNKQIVAADKGTSAGRGAFLQQIDPRLAPSNNKPQDTTPPVTPPPQQPNAKIIKTGELAVEVPSYEPAVERVQAIVTQGGGFIADATTQEQSGGALTGRVVVRVAPERFEGLFATLKTIGRVESENVKAADVTAEYVDLEARIHSHKITEERLQELVKNKSIVDKISALLEVERELNRVRSEIEQFEGQLRVMADRVALSTISLTLREPARTVPSASLSVEVTTVSETADALSLTLDRMGGRLRSGQTAKRADGTLSGTYQLTVSLARFGELLKSIESLGRVEGRQVSDRQFGDATAPWADTVQCSVALVLYERSRQLPAGTMRLEVAALEGAMARLNDLLSKHGASITSNHTSRQNDGSNLAELRIRVSAGRFAELVDGLEPFGRVTAKNINGEAGAIVGGAAETLCELILNLAERAKEVPQGEMAIEVASFEPARQALSTLIHEKKVQVLHSASSQRTDGTWVGSFHLGVAAGDMESVVTQLGAIGRVISRQINGLGLGDLSQHDPSTLGTINLTLAEKSAIAPGPDKAGDSIRNHLRGALTALYTSLGLIAYGLIVLAPWLAIVLLLAWLLTRVRRRRMQTAPASV